MIASGSFARRSHSRRGNVRALRDRVADRVALKVLRPDRGNDEAVARLFREARSAAGLTHPNTVAIHDVGEAEGIFYIVMVLVTGVPLLAYVGDDRVPAARKLAWLVDVARAPSAAHKAGVIHRDVKPSNVMIIDDGIVKVLDFGLAKPIAPVSFRTQKGQVLGTPRYMAPEQLAGHEVDTRTDQYAYGLTAYELVAGAHPGGVLAGPKPACAAPRGGQGRDGVGRARDRADARARGCAGRAHCARARGSRPDRRDREGGRDPERGHHARRAALDDGGRRHGALRERRRAVRAPAHGDGGDPDRERAAHERGGVDRVDEPAPERTPGLPLWRTLQSRDAPEDLPRVAPVARTLLAAHAPAPAAPTKRAHATVPMIARPGACGTAGPRSSGADPSGERRARAVRARAAPVAPRPRHRGSRAGDRSLRVRGGLLRLAPPRAHHQRRARGRRRVRSVTNACQMNGRSRSRAARAMVARLGVDLHPLSLVPGEVPVL